MKQDENRNEAKSKASNNILVMGIIGGLLLGAILTVITQNPSPQMGIGLAVGIVIAAGIMLLRNKK